MLRACCSARISVGAISAVCKPFSIAAIIAITATMVLPLPTSPCSRRFIGAVDFMSLKICSVTFRCACVNLKGITKAILSLTVLSMRSGISFSSLIRCPRFKPIAKVTQKKSSKIMRRCAALLDCS